MALEPEFMQQLMATFQIELEERLQTITDGLLALEKKGKKKGNVEDIIEEISRAAHNIKGAARGLGIASIGDIVHHIESLFSSIKEKKTAISAEIIDVALASVDAIRSASQSFATNSALSFDLQGLLDQLKCFETSTDAVAKKPTNTTNKNEEAQPKPKPATKEAASAYHNNTTEHESIRIPVDQIEKVSVLIEQMQINKIGIEEGYKSLIALASLSKQLIKGRHTKGEDWVEIDEKLQQIYKIMRPNMAELGSINNALQEEMARLRLVPASSLLRYLERYVRDLALELHKEIELEISGAQVKLDKMILDGLKDPIIHILRNAMDHGIENIDVRHEKGKPACAKIHLDIIDEGNQIVINISDDGAGIDVQKIGSLALKRKLITEEELDNMTQDEILEFIFRPEFSTKEIITTLSGRGIGLDVVKSNVADLKGSVSFETEKDQGTIFHLHLPLTLSSDFGLTIRSGGQLFVIPVSAVLHVMMIRWEDIYEVEGNQIVLFDQKPVPLRILSDVLSLKKQEPGLKHWLPIVIMKKGWNTIALLVEEILGECEIVIKPLQAPLAHVPCVSGGTLFGNGEIIIVLNPEDLIKRAFAGYLGRLKDGGEGSYEAPPKHHILLVDDSITTRTLEKNILESNDYKVTAAVDGAEAWDLLQKQDFSLIITDIQMPKMDGFELTERIKKSSKYQDIPVIIVTSLGSDEQKKHGIDVGANAYIVKHDFESTELLDIVGQLV